MIHKTDYQSDSIFSRLLSQHTLLAPFSQALRSRTEMIGLSLNQVCEDFPDQEIKIMSASAGSSPELYRFHDINGRGARLIWHFMDHDNLALREIEAEAKGIGIEAGRIPELRLLQESPRLMSFPGRLPEEWRDFHFIYAMGLFDTLLPDQARAVLGRLYGMLRPGGSMVIGNFHIDSPDRIYMDYWLDWTLYYRTEEEFIDLLNEDSRSESMISFDDTGIQMYLHVRKPG